MSSSPSAPAAVQDRPADAESRQPGWPAAILLYLAIASLLCCIRLGSTDAITMEGIVADGARYMADTREYAVPRLHGEIYSYKPPLAYWMALVSFRAFGEETEWTLRLPFAASGMVMGLGVLLLVGRALGPGTGLLCAFASLTGVIVVQKLQLAEFDMPLAAGVGLAVAAACRSFAADRPSVVVWGIGYLGLAAGFLAKGAPALIFYGPGLLAAAISTRRLKQLLRPAHLAGALLFLLVALGWFWSAFAAEGWAAFEQPLAEADEKGFSWTLSDLASTLAKPVVAWALFLPWTLLLSFSRDAWRSRDGPARRMGVAAAAFAVTGLLVFMLVPATESRYLLPLAAPVGIVCGLAARDALASGVGRLRRRVTEALVLAAGVCAVILGLTTRAAAVPGRTLLALCGAAAVGLVGFGLRSDSRRHVVRLVCAAALLSWLAQVVVVTPHRAGSRSLRSVAVAFDRHLSPGETVWTGPVSKHWRRSSLFFYLRHPVKTFSAAGPPAGAPLILVSEEHRDLMTRMAGRYSVVERKVQGDCEFILGRAESGQRLGEP